ncbi:porin [Sphingorhabdus sp.]|uniref:OprO/OprP family phosphate-selective porin n=1 Tax=Sphingorhabdus sp. TaxID=1902408 RepID=UPI00359420FE
MKSLRLVTGTLALALVTFTNPASASESDPEVAALKAEVAALKEQLAKIAAKVDAAAEKGKDASKILGEVKWKGAPEITGNGGWSFKPRGRLQYDFATVSTPEGLVDRGLGFSNEVRRARLGVEGTIPGGFGYRMEGDFSSGGVELIDAYLTYLDNGLTLTVGQHNNFQSLDELTSTNDGSFIERAAFTDAFGFQRRIGISAQYTHDNILLQGGVFTDNIDDLGNDENDSIGVDGRVVFAPVLGKTQLHIGTSIHVNDLGDNITTLRYSQRPLVHSTDTRFIDTSNITFASSEKSFGLEAAVISGRFHTVAEMHQMDVNRIGLADPRFYGAMVEAGIFLTRDSRSYKDGYFRSIKVTNPVGKGGMGALQFNVRYDRLDISDAGVNGGKQDGYLASFIWNPVDYIRFLVNYGHLSYKDAAIIAGASRDYAVDVVAMRAQVNF